MIIGPSQSGKTSILSAILGGMKITNGGSLKVDGTISLVSEIPWLMNGTIRNNILFGKEYNEQRYLKIVRDCCLEEDFNEVIPEGDLFEFYQDGEVLTESQKMKISIARALYSNSDIYLFDDPLKIFSDKNEAIKMFNQVFKPLFSNQKKTCVMVTSQKLPLEMEPDATVLLMNLQSGGIDSIGTFNTLPEAKLEFLNLDNNQQKQVEYFNPKQLYNDIIEDEEDVNLLTLFGYFGQVGRLKVLLVILFLTVAQLSIFCIPAWILKWNKLSSTHRISFFIGLYILVLVIKGISTFIYKVLPRFGDNRAIPKIHCHALNKLFQSPILFLKKQNLAGINSMIHDLTNETNQLVIDGPFSKIVPFWKSHLELLVWLLIIYIATPMTFVVSIPLLLYFRYLKRVFLNTQYQLINISKNSNNQVLKHLHQTISGLKIIKTMGLSDSFSDEMIHKLDVYSSTNLLKNLTQCWLTFRISMACSFLVLSISVSALLYHKWISQEPEIYALCLFYSTILAMEFQNTIAKGPSSFEPFQILVHKIQSYYDLEEEDDPGTILSNLINLPKDWPSNGEIIFSNFSTNILNNFNLVITSGSKLDIYTDRLKEGIQIMESLYRMVDGAEGSIKISGFDIKDISLTQLRYTICLIPYNPVLLEESLRFNLDPYNKYSDTDIKAVIEILNLGPKLSEFDSKIFDNHFNLEQKQLICLGRGLLRKSKLIVFEPNIVKNSISIQRIMNQYLQNSTILY
eukprot:gene5162-6425_t